MPYLEQDKKFKFKYNFTSIITKFTPFFNHTLFFEHTLFTNVHNLQSIKQQHLKGMCQGEAVAILRSYRARIFHSYKNKENIFHCFSV